MVITSIIKSDNVLSVQCRGGGLYLEHAGLTGIMKHSFGLILEHLIQQDKLYSSRDAASFLVAEETGYLFVSAE